MSKYIKEYIILGKTKVIPILLIEANRNRVKSSKKELKGAP